MYRRIRHKKNRKKVFLGGLALVVVPTIMLSQGNNDFYPTDNIVDITIVDDGTHIDLEDVPAKTIAEAVKFYDEKLDENDRIFPSPEHKVFSNDIIKINREKAVKIKIADEEQEVKTYGDSLKNIVAEANIELDDNDLITPSKNTFVNKDLEVEIVKVEIKEEKETEKIPFKTVNREDPEVSFLKKYIETEGEKGEKEIIYEVSYHNGEEVDRKKIDEVVTKEPVDKVVIQGTRMKLGKADKGSATWYAYTGTLACASRDYPKGAYLKVTNQGNGKSVVVIVNDYGPAEWTGHIIDLDKVAFQEIAGLGAGVIGVKVEQILE